MSSVYRLYSTWDLVGYPTAEWRRVVYAPHTCAACTALQRSDPCGGWGTDLDPAEFHGRNPTLETLVGPVVAVWNTDALIARRDLAYDLQLEQRGFCLGQVTLGGNECRDYCSVVTPQRLAIRIQCDRVLRTGEPCPVCESIGRRMDFNAPFWFHSEQVQGLDVFSDESGKFLYVTPETFSSIRDSVRQELDPKKLEVR
jgi:hypothetical protein